MKSARIVLGLLCLVLLPTLASAQTWNAEQQEVWKLEEQQWQMAKDKDLSWIDKMVHPNISYWDVDQPGPQNKASLRAVESLQQHERDRARTGAVPHFPDDYRQRRCRPVPLFGREGELQERAGNCIRTVHGCPRQGGRPLAVHRLVGRATTAKK